MKLISAGIAGENTVFTKHLFNCTRDPHCQRAFFVPLRNWSDLVLFADLPGKPDAIEGTVELLDICDPVSGGGDFNDDFNDDFDIGETPLTSHSVIFNSFVVGQKPDGSWYGVFGSPMVDAGENVKCFFLKISLMFAGVEYVYYTEQFCFDNCAGMKYLQACYPNEPVGAEAEDCNGIYYGYPVNEDTLGNPLFRYLHWGYVRDASVTEQNNKLFFSVFNSKKTYKTVLDRESLLEFELLPTFYKNTILGIIARGDIKIDGQAWRLAEDQDIQIIDTDSKLWRMDISLAEQCKQNFGCADECTLPGCSTQPNDAAAIADFRPPDNLYFFSLIGGVFLPGEIIEYELRRKDTDELINSGTMIEEPLTFLSDVTSSDFANHCYVLKWRKNCGTEEAPVWSDYRSKEFGLCASFPFTLRAASKDFDLTEEIIFQYSVDLGASWHDIGQLTPNQVLAEVGTLNLPNDTAVWIGALRLPGHNSIKHGPFGVSAVSFCGILQPWQVGSFNDPVTIDIWIASDGAGLAVNCTGIGDGNISVENCMNVGRITQITHDFVPILTSGGGFPLNNGENLTGHVSSVSNGDLVVSIDGVHGSIKAIDSDGNMYCFPYAGPGDYTFPDFVINSGAWLVVLQCGVC